MKLVSRVQVRAVSFVCRKWRSEAFIIYGDDDENVVLLPRGYLALGVGKQITRQSNQLQRQERSSAS